MDEQGGNLQICNWYLEQLVSVQRTIMAFWTDPNECVFYRKHAKALQANTRMVDQYVNERSTIALEWRTKHVK